MKDEGLSYRSYYTPSRTSAFLLIQDSRWICHFVADKQIETLFFLCATICYNLPAWFLTFLTLEKYLMKNLNKYDLLVFKNGMA